jgi:hypothetical protein
VIEQGAPLWHQAQLPAIELDGGGLDVKAGGVELGTLEQHPRERALAGAGAAQDHRDLARGQRQRQVIDEDATVGELDAEPRHLQAGGSGHAATVPDCALACRLLTFPACTPPR